MNKQSAEIIIRLLRKDYKFRYPNASEHCLDNINMLNWAMDIGNISVEEFWIIYNVLNQPSPTSHNQRNNKHMCRLICSIAGYLVGISIVCAFHKEFILAVYLVIMAIFLIILDKYIMSTP
jgi:hypothetical protein